MLEASSKASKVVFRILSRLGVALLALGFLVMTAASAPGAPSPAPASPAGARGSARALEAKIRAVVASARPRMRIGVSLVHLKSGQRVDVDAGDPYPLASVFKLPLMIELVRQIQEGRGDLRLDAPLVVTEPEKCIGSGRLKASANGSKVTVARCIELMETISDNTATDMLFLRVGLDSVNRMMRGLGLAHSDIYLTNRAAWLISLGQGSAFRRMGAREIAKRWLAMSAEERKKAAVRVLEENRGLSLAKFQAIEDASAAKQTGAAYDADVAVAQAVDNVSSPRDMADLLRLLVEGRVLQPRWTEYCLGVLGRQRYNTRIPQLLPAGTRTFHKTGTIVGVVNDAGLVRISKDNQFVVVVFVRDVRQGAQGEAERAIARIARLAYDAWR